MNKLFDILLKLGIVAILIIAATTEQHYNYYAFVRWTLFIASIYFANKSRQTGIVGVILFCAIGILFNPFIPFTFQKKVWHIIDLVVAVLMLILIDWKSYKEELSSKGKLIHDLIKSCIWGSVAMLVAVWFIFSQTGNPYNEFLLITKATTAKGFIINSEEQEDVAEQEGHAAVQVYDVYYEYTFTTKEGKTIKDHASDRNPEPGYLKEANEKPIPIEVEYISNNPQINRIKDMNLQCKTITEFIWRRLGLGILMLIMFCSIGFVMIRNAIKEYLTETKKYLQSLKHNDTKTDSIYFRGRSKL